MTNHLAGESSPYLLQHAGNPVDWYPWGPEALRCARERDVPIFLSIGYSACHWCHVMEHESFSDPDTAALLNECFVSIKVDREERPDLDAIYMQAVTALAGRGGWPLSVWLTPDGAPFYGGTYFPPRPRYGMSSFKQVLGVLASAWTARQAEVQEAAVQLLAFLGRDASPGTTTTPRALLLAEAAANLHDSFDRVNGGWGQAPKFPMPLALEFLLARHNVSPDPRQRTVIESALDAMAAGGIYDHLGGGFHRYSTDEAWLVPHFEKMLYDNAQLARCYLHAWQSFGKARHREVVQETLDYLLRDMRHPQGGFFSAEDADSEGKEGAFFVWTLEQIRETLDADEAAIVASTYGVTSEGNFEGATVLHLAAEPQASDAALAVARAKLLAARERRLRPRRDDKILAAWNGLALAALSEAALALDSDSYREAAIKAGGFIARELVRDGDRLARSWKDGRSSGNGFLEDYSFVAEGLLALYQTTFDARWFALARDLANAMIEHFGRPEGGFYDTSADHESLIIRPRTLQDSPVPSGNSMAATVLLKLAAFTGEGRYSDLAEETLASAPATIEDAPVMSGQWLLASFLAETGLTEVAVVGDLAHPLTKALLAGAQGQFRPAGVVAAGLVLSPHAVPLLEGRSPDGDSEAAAWVCRRSTCYPPTSDPAQLSEILDGTP